MPEYRRTQDTPEIVSFIRRSKQGTALLWQPNFGQEKAKQEVKDIMVSESRGIVRFYFDTLDTTLDLSNTIYVKLPYLDSVFRSYVSKTTYRYIELDLPLFMMAPELRKIPRSCFIPDDNKKIYMGYMSEIMKKAVQTVGVICVDISRHGLGFYVSEKNKTNFAPKSEVYLEALGDYKLPQKISSQVVYSVPKKIVIKDKEMRVNRVGVTLSEAIPEEILQEFLF